MAALLADKSWHWSVAGCIRRNEGGLVQSRRAEAKQPGDPLGPSGCLPEPGRWALMAT